MSKSPSLWAGAVVVAAASATYAYPVYTVDSVGALDPNPSAIGITEVGNTSLAAARTLVSAAHAAGTGGTLDFQQQFQGGTFPNAPSSNNGVDFAAGAAAPLQVTASSTAGAGGLVATGPVIWSMYRLEADGTGVNNDFDSNTNQGGSIISGGYKSRDPIAAGTAITGSVDFTTNPPTVDSVAGTATAGVGGSYMGITNTGSPATMVFDGTPLSFFGITAIPRGATRDTLITLTEVPVAGGASISVPIGATTVVGTNAIFFGQTANVGYVITRAAFTNPNAQGVNRYDDLAFVTATPEPASLGLAGMAGMALLRRRQRGR